MYDTFVAAMTCPHCGAVSPADGSTNMQTRIRDDAHHLAIPVGFEFEPYEVLDQNLEDSGYVPTGHASPDGKKRLINLWFCRTCHLRNFAEITFDGPRVAAIEVVPRARASMARVQFVERGAMRRVEEDESGASANTVEHAVLKILELGALGWHEIAVRLGSIDVPRGYDLMAVLDDLRGRGLVINVPVDAVGDRWELTARGRAEVTEQPPGR